MQEVLELVHGLLARLAAKFLPAIQRLGALQSLFDGPLPHTSYSSIAFKFIERQRTTNPKSTNPPNRIKKAPRQIIANL